MSIKRFDELQEAIAATVALWPAGWERGAFRPWDQIEVDDLTGAPVGIYALHDTDPQPQTESEASNEQTPTPPAP